MAKPSLVTGLDIGTSSIKILLAQKESGSAPQAVFLTKESSSGIRRGVVVGTEEVTNLLNNSLSKIKEETGLKINSVFVNVDGSHIFSLPSRGTIAVSRADQKISEEDISRVLQAAQTISLASNKEIFDAIPREFIIDGEKGIKEAVGLQGVRLEAEVLVLGGFAPYLKNLSQAVLNSDLQISDIIPSPIAAARAVLTPRQKELGVAVLDIGAGTTGMAVFEEGDLIHLAVLPMGSANITNDIAIGLKVDVEVAERIKIEFGSYLAKGGAGSRAKEKIKLADDEESLVLSRRAINEIIEDRTCEIFEEVQKELRSVSKEKLLPAGIVITGGGAKLPRITELAKRELKLPCKIGKPRGISDLEEDPSLSTVCGLVLQGLDSQGENPPMLGGFKKGVSDKAKRIFRFFLP
ncbi:MAG: cell division protein FtsA [Candidatus Nealsonbacteria bacterium CG11_big_fil_rev_8_21_14_0_20_39_9]|uniref:Cell division protein FtsA n=1 Tax=Candidatus Nealsonbacteria bacterium CG11_big_fil_rev_8_21_14_0_20_39_9 TaxID=1974715 RepID=A0A2H0MNP8_9BACT|nr:MAG: cell division protein FtsA [Candidatus Nealsonbacteria bacterium CG11_big_fil_rev_8_21_14_0_20_39_9]